MNKNVTAVILIVLAIGVYFTYTSGKLGEIKAVQAVNAQYQKAIADSDALIKQRDAVLQSYNAISPDDLDRLNKILPDNVDNVRLIIDVKDDIAARHGLVLKNIKTTSPNDQANQQTGTPAPGAPENRGVAPSGPAQYGTVTLSFSVSTDYQTFIDFMKDLESSLRLMDISKLTVTANDTGIYSFDVEVKTYWLKQ